MSFRPHRALSRGFAHLGFARVFSARAVPFAVAFLAASVTMVGSGLAAPKPDTTRSEALQPGAGSSPAQRALGAPDLILPDDLQSIVEIATGYGEAKLEKTESGDPVVVGDIDGVSYQLFFLDCTAHRDCKVQNFYAIWDTPGVSLETINDWNRAQPFHKAYLTEDNFPAIELNISIAGGTSRAQMVDAFDRWTVALAEFQAQILDPAL